MIYVQDMQGEVENTEKFADFIHRWSFEAICDCDLSIALFAHRIRQRSVSKIQYVSSSFLNMSVPKKFHYKNTCCLAHMSIKLGRQYTCIYDTLY